MAKAEAKSWANFYTNVYKSSVARGRNVNIDAQSRAALMNYLAEHL